MLHSMPFVWPAPRRSPPAPYSEVRCKSSFAAATERQPCQLNLHSKESVDPINVANLRVNQRSQINEDTVKPSLAAQNINPITYAPGLIFRSPRRNRTQFGPAD